jgi:hypothetical protein
MRACVSTYPCIWYVCCVCVCVCVRAPACTSMRVAVIIRKEATIDQTASIFSFCSCCHANTPRVGQNGIYTPYMTIYLVISLPKKTYIYRVYMWFWPTLHTPLHFTGSPTSPHSPPGPNPLPLAAARAAASRSPTRDRPSSHPQPPPHASSNSVPSTSSLQQPASHRQPRAQQQQPATAHNASTVSQVRHFLLCGDGVLWYSVPGWKRNKCGQCKPLLTIIKYNQGKETT